MSMIAKPLDQIAESDLTGLITAAVPEQRTIDYKREIQPMNDAGTRELLADVSSFANTAGGDLIFGMTESGGVPTGVPGIALADPDQTILQLDGIIRTGLDPRIRHTSRAIKLVSGQYVLIIRSEQSWYGPHRVIFKGNGRFYARTSNGKYELDVTELRNAFLFSNTVTERIAAFRSERVVALEAGRSLVPVSEGPKLVLHAIPLGSFSSRRSLEVMKLRSFPAMMRPMGRDGFGAVRVNFDGVICTAYGDVPTAYTQVYRDGVIEAVGVGFLSGYHANSIPGLLYEETVMKYLPICFEIVNHLGCYPPLIIGITLIGVRGMSMATAATFQLDMGGGTAIDRDVLMLPAIIVENLAEDPGKVLKSSFDMVWNACGYPSSPNFDKAGNWSPRSGW
jgi:Putative DNA-binding domain